MPKYTDHREMDKLLSAAYKVDHDNRIRAREAQDFLETPNGQWEPHWSQVNETENKPRYQFDVTNPIVDQIAGEIEQTSFDIKVSPVDAQANKETAFKYDGIIRSIENMSNADRIYKDAARNFIASGIHGWMVEHDYASDMSFDQDLLIKPIHDFANRVWFDTNSQTDDASDARYAFLLTAMSRNAYEEEFPKGSKMSVSVDRTSTTYYNRKEEIVVATVFYIKGETVQLVKTNTGRVFQDTEKFQQIQDELEFQGEFVVDRRKVKKNVCFQRIMDGKGWLTDAQRTVFNRIPIIPVYGNFKLIDDGKIVYRGVVEKMKDPQRVLNYSLSRQIEEGALAPRSKYWMTEAQATGHEHTLATLNTNAHPVQFYNADPAAPGPPQQNGGAQINEGLLNISTSMLDLAQRISGLFAASIGEDPNVQSGIAVEKLQRRGSLGSMKYLNALKTGITATAKILVDAIPEVFSGERIVRILGRDGTVESILANQQVFDEDSQTFVTINDLSEGRYDVVCNVGPSYQTRQEQLLKTLTEVSQQFPEILQVSSDILLSSLSSPETDIIAARLRKQLIQSGQIPQEQMTEEELQEFQAAQEAAAQQPDAASILAQAEQEKAQAARDRVQVEAQKAQVSLEEKRAKLQLDQQKEQRESAKLQADIEARNIEMSLKEMSMSINRQVNEQKMLIQTISALADNVEKNSRALQNIKNATGADAIVSEDLFDLFERQVGVTKDAQDDAT